MYQTALFEFDQLTPIVNVASVPQLSPFRYPGGKTWLVPRVRYWLSPIVRQQAGISPEKPMEFIEPFLGGGIVSLTVAAERLAEHVTMVELDADVAAVWQTMLDPEAGEWLARAILTFELTLDNVAAITAGKGGPLHEQALRTIVRNRVNHGGILAPGSGVLKYGEEGKGIKSRWYPDTLAKRIRRITSMRERITFIHGDGLAVAQENAERTDAVFFIDPPYTMPGRGKRAGSRLYTHYLIDHQMLFDLAARLKGDFLMTYDIANEVQMLADQHGFVTQLISMKNTHHAKMTELLIAPNLGWLDWPRLETPR